MRYTDGNRGEILGKLNNAQWERLAALKEMPKVPMHPLRKYLEDRGLSVRQGVKYLPISLRTLAEVTSKWIVPIAADTIARGLGVSAEDLFPDAKPVPKVLRSRRCRV